MNKNCIGCGVLLQNTDKLKPGYIIENNSHIDLCMRCFKLKNYGEFEELNMDYDLNNNLGSVNKDDLIIHVVDLFNFYEGDVLGNLKKNSVLVLTKRDTLPKSLNDYKMISLIKKIYPNYLDYIIVSSKKNYNLDNLFSIIKRYKKVYFVGNTNSGKSTLLNRIIKNYSKNISDITTSRYPSTTVDNINIELNENITVVDTPGMVDKFNIINNIDIADIKRVSVENEIGPRIYQFTGNITIFIDKFGRIDCEANDNCDLVIYTSNKLDVERRNKNTIFELPNNKVIDISLGKEVVINGLCVIKTNKDAKLNIKTINNVSIYIRDSIFY